MTKSWTKEWPKKPGRYWFYGWPYGQTHTTLDKLPVKPELNAVFVWGGGNVVRDGHFWYERDGGIGLFCEAEELELPDVSGMAPKVERPKKGRK